MNSNYLPQSTDSGADGEAGRRATSHVVVVQGQDLGYVIIQNLKTMVDLVLALQWIRRPVTPTLAQVNFTENENKLAETGNCKFFKFCKELNII